MAAPRIPSMPAVSYSLRTSAAGWHILHDHTRVTPFSCLCRRSSGKPSAIGKADYLYANTMTIASHASIVVALSVWLIAVTLLPYAG